MAIEDTFGSVDPNQVVDSLTQQSFPDGLNPGPVDPNDVVDRLLRKIAGRRAAASDIKFSVPKDEEPAPGAPDLSKQGTPASELPDLSSEGIPADQVKQPAPDQGLSFGQGAAALGKGIPAGAVEGTGAALQGAGVLSNRMSALPVIDPNSGMPIDGTGSPYGTTIPTAPPPPGPVNQNPLYQAGTAVKEFGERNIPMSDAEKASIPGRVGRAVGGVLPTVAAAAIDPALGVAVGAGTMGLQSAGDTFEAAIKKGASEDDAAKAAGLSGIVGSVLGGIPLAVVLKPVKMAAPGFMKTAMESLAEAASKVPGAATASAVNAAGRGYPGEILKGAGAFASVGEAQEYLADQIANKYYDKDAGYIKDFDARRVVASLLTGGILGAGGHFMRQRADRAGPEATPAAPDARLGGPGPGPGPSPGPGTTPPGGGPSGDQPGAGPNARTGAQPGSGGATAGAPGPEPARPAPGADFRMDPSIRMKMEKVYRAFRMAGDPADLSDADLFNAVNAHVNSGSGARPETPEDVAARQQAATERTEREALKARGWTDAHIDAMTPEQRRKYFQDAMGGAQTPPPEEKPSTQGAQEQPASSSEAASTSLNENERGATTGGTRTEPIKATTADDVLKASGVVAEPKSDAQAKAENYQHGHLEIEHLGLTGRNSISVETGVGQERKGVENGKEWKINLPVAYGRIKGTKGADGQPLDIFVGPQPTSQHVFIIDQHHNKGGFDEHKIMAGFTTPRDALRAYSESYADGGGNRIGHVVALTPDEFKSWLKGDTTKPFKRETASAPDAGSEAAQRNTIALTEATPAGDVPKVATQEAGGPSPSPAAEATIHTGDESSARSPTEGEIISPSRVTAEPTKKHHDQIEAVLGQDYDRVLPVDAARAAEILAERPGISAELAFQYAVIQNAVSSKLLTHQQVEKIYGEGVNQVLEPGAEGASGGGAPVEQGGTASREGVTSGAEEAGVVSSGGEAGGRQEPAERGAGAEAQDEQQHDTGRGEPDTGRKAGGEPAEEGAGGATNSIYSYRVDNPGGEWLANKQQDALSDERNKQTRGSPTAFVRGRGSNQIALPTSMLKNLPGLRDEVRRTGDAQFDALLADVKKSGWSNSHPILIKVNHLGRPFIVEGNTRVAVADAVGQKSVPVWIDWMNGAENVVGPWSPDNILPKLERPTEEGIGGTEEPFFKYAGENDTGLSDASRADLAAHYEKEAERFIYDDGRPHGPNEAINVYLGNTNKEFARQARDGEQFDKDKAIRAGNAAQKKYEREQAAGKKVEQETGTTNDQYGKQMEAAIDKIEEAVEANDRKAVLKAAGEARKLLASVPKAIKAADAPFWNDFPDLIKKLMKPGAVTAKQEVEAAEKQKIEDAGEKIGGARKDAWIGRGIEESDLEGMTGAELDKYVSKSNVWARPDYVQAVENGVEPLAAALIKRIYDRIGTKPNNGKYGNFDLPELRKRYIKTLKKVRDAFADAKTADDVKKVVSKLRDAIEYGDQQTIYQAGARYSPIVITGKDKYAAEKAVAEGFPNAEPWTRLFLVQDRLGTEKYTIWRKSGGRVGDVYDTREEAEAAAKAAYEALPDGRKEGGETPNRPHLDAINRDGPDYRKGRDVTGEDFVKDFGFRGVEFGNWVASDERQKVVNLAYDALHDLARVLKVPPKAISLDGTLAVAFGARGRGGRAAAHYEPDRTVINMTKLSGAGSLAHEWGHALDHYLGQLGVANAYDVSSKFYSGGRKLPDNNVGSYFAQNRFEHHAKHLPRKLRAAANRLMHDIFNVEEDDEASERKLIGEIESRKSGLKGWQSHLEGIKETMRAGGSRSGITQAETQVKVWGDALKRLEAQLASGNLVRRTTRSSFYLFAQKLSGQGDYWHRPTELFARSFEAYVFDKIASEGFTSQYLVQGVEPNRFGSGFRGNPYPAGIERETINADYDRVVRAIAVGEGKLGANTRIQSAEGEPEPVATVTRVKRPAAQPSMVDEAKAVEEASQSMSDAFAQEFRDGKAFETILQARKLARERFNVDDPKVIEEAIEFGVVKAAREIVEENSSFPPKETFNQLVDLYGRQPRLGTRTSSSVRDQAYSTPVPLGYLASRLADITRETSVLEPTAGNGALLIDADPTKVTANEINDVRRTNLGEQGFSATAKDASQDGAFRPGFDRVIANPPFGPLREAGESKVFDLSDIQPGYQTTEIDHAIALRSLAAMRDDGRAVMILGGLNKQITTPEGRSDAYNGKSKRLFYKALYDRYNVIDHFTVNGDLYERQGAGWPVDVIVINGRGKSARALPAVDVPRIYETWDALGGLLDGLQSSAGNARRAVGSDAGPAEGQSGVAGSGGADRGDARSEQPGPEQSGEVRAKRSSRTETTGGSSAEAEVRPGEGGQPGRSGEQPAAERPSSGLSDADIASFVNDAIEEAYAEPVSSDPAIDNVSSRRTEPIESAQGKYKGYASTNDGGRLSVDAYGDTAADAQKNARERLKREYGERAKKRTTEENVKSAAKGAVEAADEAFTGLYKLFGGGETIGMAGAFDDKTYAQAKPHFKKAAEKFRDAWGDLRELARRMVGHMRDVLKWPKKVMQELSPYLEQFFQDMREGKIKLGEEPAGAKTERKAAQAVETEGQVRYNPQSKAPGLDTLVPTNMRSSIEDSLGNLEKRVGPIDDFVMKELGYTDPDAFHDAFGAEQVDALGLAIDNIKRGRGFIIGDQTGIGKGRVNAAIIKWALNNDRIPIFVTKGPALYADIYRDMTDIGMDAPRMLATNATLTLPLHEDGSVKLKTGSAKEHNALLASLASKKAFQAKYDMVLTNYSQMQTLKGEDTARRQFLHAIAPHSVMVMDESHEAGGQKKSVADKGPADRAGFARELIERANGVFYSSATYAKRPDVMDLYAATDMAMAVEDVADLGEAISRGGVPMQQAVAAMLARAGQYIRRERSFDGINYNTPTVPVERETYDGIARSLAAIQAFSRHVGGVAERISDEIKAEAGAMASDSATGEAGASSTNFTAIMHNIINQMLLAMKADHAARRAIDLIDAGEKPVLTVANTMESFLKEYAAELEAKPGEVVSADFGDVLRRYLKRSRVLIIRKPFAKKGETERRELTDADLGPHGVMLHNTAAQLIKDVDLSKLPISPIDHIKGKIERAGYSVGEITGRSLGIDYTGKEPVLRTRAGKELTTAGRNETRAAFNKKPENGGMHAIIINQAGSTGISMHASKTFNDQSKRRMMIVQAEGNIDTHMQLLGRVNRTGQVVLPEYDQLVLEAPAEKRPAAVLSKKMASLNANTTASRTSAVTAKDVPDFMNQYGDEVAASLIADDPDLNMQLGRALKVSSETGKVDKADAMRRLTGRIPLLRLAHQEELYNLLEGEYAALLEQLNAAGENALEAKSLDLKAKPLERTVVQGQRNNSGSPFAEPVTVEKASVARLGKPFKPEEVVQRMADAIEAEPGESPEKFIEGIGSGYSKLGQKSAIKAEIEKRTQLEKFRTYLRAVVDEITDVEKQKKETDKLNTVRDRWTSLIDQLHIGQATTLRTANGNLTGFVIKVEQKGEPKNPLALGSWKATFAVSDATRQITLPFSRIVAEGKADPESMLDVEAVPLRYEQPHATLKRFALMQDQAREERYIATGNILSAFDWLSHKGSIVNYTVENGDVRQGILLPRGFDLDKHAIGKGRAIHDPVEVKTWLEKNPTETLWTRDKNLSIRRESPYSDRYTISTSRAKKVGGVYFLDKQLTDLTGDFYSRGGNMVADLAGDKLVKAVQRMMQLGAQFSVQTSAPKAQKVEPEPGPQQEQPRGNPSFGAFGSPDLIVRTARDLWDGITGLFTASRRADFIEIMSDFSHREKLLQKEVEARMLGLTPAEVRRVFPETSNLSDAMQFYVKKELIPGKVAHDTDIFRRQLLKPLVKIANEAGISVHEIGDYLMAKGAYQRNRMVSRLYTSGHPFFEAMRDPDVVGGSGFSNNEAMAKVRDFETSPRGTAFKAIWRTSRGMVNFTRQKMVQYGLESQTTIDGWAAHGDAYVPYKGFEEDADDGEKVNRGGSPVGIRGPETKRAFGRESKADNPLVNLVDQAYRTIERGQRNVHYNSLANALATMKANGIDIDDIVSLQRGQPKQVIDKNTGLAKWVNTAPSAMDKGAVNFKRNGQPRTMLFESEKLAAAINRNSPWSFPGLHTVLLGVNKLKSLWTHYSPDFAARHFFGRYMVEGALNAYQLRDSGAYSPRRWIADAFPAIGRASRAINDFENGRPSGQLGVYWAEMKANGGHMAFRAMRDINTIKNELVDDLKQITSMSRLNPLRMLRAITAKTDEIFNVWDNATRLATFAQAREQGMSPQQAAYRARNATVNYQKKGLIANVAGVLLPFFNTAVRTGVRMSSALMQSNRMRRVFMGVFAAGVALALNNYLLGGTDTDGVPFFEKVPDYERALGFIFLNPFERDAKGRPQKYALPNAYNYALPMTFGYHLTGMFLNQIGAIKSTISLKEHMLDLTKSTFMAFTPLGETGNLMDLITPEIVRPLAHIAENKTWTGAPVHNDMFQKGPNAESGRPDRGGYVRTGEGWKDAAQVLNKATGGSKTKSGLIDMYPEDIREIVDQMFGAQKRFGLEVRNTSSSILHGEVPKATDVPIGKVFRGVDYEAANRVRAAKQRYEQSHPWQR